jgi:hypothetical protein
VEKSGAVDLQRQCSTQKVRTSNISDNLTTTREPGPSGAGGGYVKLDSVVGLLEDVLARPGRMGPPGFLKFKFQSCSSRSATAVVESS